jgi:glutamate 5-kinase
VLRQEIAHSATIVVKVGSRILASPEDVPQSGRVRSLVDSIATLIHSGKRVLLVSSGAIAHGMQTLRFKKRPSTIPMQQACASIGQIRLMNRYEACFAKHRIPIGQVLLTWDDLRDKKRYLNLRNTLFTLIDCGAVPIINENDSVGVEEIRFGENDTLAAQISLLVQADLFVNLTDINGLYDADPSATAGARHIPLVENITDAVRGFASGKTGELSVGGMATKLRAADIVTKAGVFALVGDGYQHTLIEALSDPGLGTLFLPNVRKMSSRHRWIAFTGQPGGALIIDDGAARAVVKNGKSLLPAGVRKVSGSFKVGDMVDIQNEKKQVVARGLANYSSDDAQKIAGCKTVDIAQQIGQKTFDEIVHRDNLVVL